MPPNTSQVSGRYLLSQLEDRTRWTAPARRRELWRHTQPMNFERYYNLETYLLDEVGRNFRDSGALAPLDFYFILTWKANRSKTTTKRRLEKLAGSFSSAVSRIASDLAAKEQPKNKLEVLMLAWAFRLPTATAILTILYPDDFTVYDVRVCDSLKRFHNLSHRGFSDSLWEQYSAFKAAVESKSPAHLSLRNKDRYLWGKSFYEESRKQCV